MFDQGSDKGDVLQDPADATSLPCGPSAVKEGRSVWDPEYAFTTGDHESRQPKEILPYLAHTGPSLEHKTLGTSNIWRGRLP